MRILPEHIDLEINILIIKVLLVINIFNNFNQMSLLLAIYTFISSFIPLYINITNLGNLISGVQKFILRCYSIASIITILHYSIHSYLNDASQFFFMFTIFSLIYNFITVSGYQSYMSKFSFISSKLLNKRYTYIKNTEGEFSCSICMDSDTCVNFVRTSCGHYYHEECIEKWITIQSNCPNCRKTIK